MFTLNDQLTIRPLNYGNIGFIISGINNFKKGWKN